jgi:hypothetical protein
MVTEEIVDGYITYSELSAVLRDIEKDSDRVKIDVVGKSAGGRNTYLLAISDRSTLERLDDYVDLASFIADNPDEALVTLDESQLDYRVPSYIQGNIHRIEREGTDTRLNPKNRGTLSPGYYADVTCFDPQTVRDTATFEASTSRPGGIVHMLVNGVAVMKDSQFMHRSP